MRSMNKENIKNDVLKAIANDKYDLPIFVCKNLKGEVLNLFKKFIKFDEKDFLMRMKVLSSGKFVIEIECLTNGFLIK